MAGKFHLVDPLKKNKARIESNGAQLVTTIPASPELVAQLGGGSSNTTKYFNGLLGSNGIESSASTTTNMSVDGSVTPQSFYVEANSEYNLVVTTIIVTIVGGSVSHSKFGDVNELTNGWDLILVQDEEVPIVNKAQTGGEVLVQTGIFGPFGGSSVNIISSFSGNNDAMIAKIPISEFTPSGMTIVRGSTNRLVSVVNDDLTGLVDFSVRIIGYRD